jgi:hypothetical protein
MADICFAVLAHNQRPCLEDLLSNLRHFAPTSEVVLYNGGRDNSLFDGLDFDVCPLSHPLRYEGLAEFHLDIIRWLQEERRRFDFLITLDSDMLLIKPGIEAYLEQTMRASNYMAVEFNEIPPDTNWKPGRRFHLKWKSIWQPIFGTHYPFGCFNPGQVFGRTFVERIMQFPRLAELRTRVERSHFPFLEEMIFPTLAVALDCAPRRMPLPDQSAIRFLGYHPPQEIDAYRRDPDVFMIHPVTMHVDSPEREMLRAVVRGGGVDVAAYQSAFVQRQPRQATAKQLRASMLGPLLAGVKDAYLRLVPE